jgi:hypothetical protein
MKRKPAAKKQPEASRRKSWSPRSQNSLLEQYKLEGEQEGCRKAIKHVQAKIGEAEKSKARQIETLSHSPGDYHSNRVLTEALSEIEDGKRKVAALEERIAALQSQIDALASPTASQARERTKKQALLAELAAVRLQEDRLLDSTLEKLREALRIRAALTARMLEIASSLDFASGSDFDSDRYDALLRSLPDEMAPASEGWLDWFLGKEKGDESCVLPDEGVHTLPETLASASVFGPGAQTGLTKDQKAQLLAQVRPPEPRLEDFAGPTLSVEERMKRDMPEATQPGEGLLRGWGMGGR